MFKRNKYSSETSTVTKIKTTPKKKINVNPNPHSERTETTNALFNKRSTRTSVQGRTNGRNLTIS